MKVHKSQRFINSTFGGWSFCCNYEFAELGRIWVVWDPSVSLTIHSKSSQMITCSVKLPQSTSEIIISFVYGLNSKTGRQQLWEELKGIARDQIVFDKPWAVLGDFNQILNPDEKSNGSTRISRGISDFRDCVDYAGLFDLTIRGNNQVASPIAKKLDRILINDHWLLKYPSAYAQFGDPDFSDHSPSCIVFGDRVQTKKHFMVSNFLLHHPEFLPRVAIQWQSMFFPGSAMFSLSNKLKLLKNELRDINREYYSDLENRVSEAHSTLIECQNLLLAHPSHLLANREKESHKIWHTLALAEERFLQQRSRVKWLESGDGNTAYFHKMVASRRSANQIHYLINTEGDRLSNMGEVKSHCVDYFQNLFGGHSSSLSPRSLHRISDLTNFRCSDTLKNMLHANVTAADVKYEVFNLPRNKSPGPDGYTGEFYRKTWDIIGHDVTEAVLEFFRSGQLLKQWNCTVISLVPKRIGADSLTDFRPISLCNVVYKIISKILARRLQEVTPLMVSNTQSAFVKGRLLVENVLLATEMVQGFGNSNISKRGPLKVDLRKAFDCVNWNFILQILETADFPPLFVNWISQCLTSTSFSINVNGELCGFFKGTRGLRQGDPMSPSLFVMAMEVYSNLLNSGFDSGLIGFHPLGRNPKVTHLAFADDIIILFDGKGSSLQP